VFDTMPVTNAFEALVGLPNFADNSWLWLYNATNSYFLPNSDWTLDYSTMKIYDISGKLLEGNDFQTYL
jgi:hypothetical protein